MKRITHFRRTLLGRLFVTCSAAARNERPCRAKATRDSRYCFFHDPLSKGARLEAQRKGAQNRSGLQGVRDLRLLLYDFDLKDANKSAELINLIAYELITGQVDPKLAYTLGYLVNLAQKINEVRERQNARRLELGVARIFRPDVHGLLQRPEHEVRRHLAQLTDDKLQEMLENAFGPDDSGSDLESIVPPSEAIPRVEGAYRTTPEALESMLTYFLNARDRITYERTYTQAESSFPNSILEPLQSQQEEIEDRVEG